MKTSKKCTLLCSVVICAIALISWSYSNHSTKKSPNYFHQYHKNLSAFMEENMSIFSAEDDWDFSPDSNEKYPPAEDVLVQRIPGDNNHMLIIAFYSKENYSGQFVTIENDGSSLIFRDNGKGDDKKAGDGFYTAKITADVKEFRQKALELMQEMKKNGYKPFHFDHRMMVIDPDVSESFEVEKMDANEPVSIAGLTNALSSDLATTATTLDKLRQNCMVITDLAVVEDPTRTWNSCKQTGRVDGPWTFGTLMRQLASKSPTSIATNTQVSDFVKKWLGKWAITQIINGDTVAAHNLVNTKILDPWQRKSGAGKPLNMRFAPFKLTAIVNRFDLRKGALGGLPNSPCGEGRFVFCLIDSNCTAALRMTVIFEYGIPRSNSCNIRKAYALLWFNLKDLTLGSSEYNQALQAITDRFTWCGTNPAKPNQSSLDKLRTNEIDLSPTIPKRWELREFELDTTGNLKEITVAQNPADKYNAKVINADVQRMVDYVNQNKDAINNETNVIPLSWEGQRFLGGKSVISIAPTGSPPNVFHWDGTDSTNKPTFITNNLSRFFFSFNTCGGCHGGETQTFFTHIDTAFYGTEARLSGFLTGRPGAGGAIDFDHNPDNDSMAVKDAGLRPTGDPRIRFFNDILRRAKDLKSVASTTCGTALSISSELMFHPTNMVH